MDISLFLKKKISKAHTRSKNGGEKKKKKGTIEESDKNKRKKKKKKSEIKQKNPKQHECA